MGLTLSIITICYNNLQDLVQTCKSIDRQTHLPLEHIIIDGSSDDDILNWLEQNDQPSWRRWIHERDNGIADAFNKGISNARGHIIHLLNSGDRYVASDSIYTVIKHFAEDPLLMWTHALFIQHRGNVNIVSGTPFEESQLWKGMRAVAHPTMFLKKELYQRHGVFNTDYKVAMDYDLLIRIRKEKFRFISTPVINFAPGGASNIHFRKGLAEVKKSFTTHIGHSTRLSLWQIRERLLYTLLRTGLGKKLFRLKNRNNRV
jgi:glycosyltransferase involved in cell wall biosynthesis